MDVKEPSPLYEKSYYSIQEYLEMERSSTTKHEYYRGEIFAMAGAGKRHNIIFGNTFAKLFSVLKGTHCRPFGSDMRIHIPENTLFTYPDISVICGDIINSPDDDDAVVSVTVVVEILSGSTRSYDMGEKFRLYRAIPALEEYMLIDSDRRHVTLYTRNGENQWQLRDFVNDDVVILDSVKVRLSLEDIYQDTKL